MQKTKPDARETIEMQCALHWTNEIWFEDLRFTDAVFLFDCSHCMELIQSECLCTVCKYKHSSAKVFFGTLCFTRF